MAAFKENGGVSSIRSDLPSQTSRTGSRRPYVCRCTVDFVRKYSESKSKMRHTAPSWNAHAHQTAVYPPSTLISVPVVYDDASDARYKYAPLSSRGSHSRPMGILPRHIFFVSGGMKSEISVAT